MVGKQTARGIIAQRSLASLLPLASSSLLVRPFILVRLLLSFSSLRFRSSLILELLILCKTAEARSRHDGMAAAAGACRKPSLASPLPYRRYALLSLLKEQQKHSHINTSETMRDCVREKERAGANLSQRKRREEAT